MTNEEFESLVNNRLYLIKKTLNTKANEYARGDSLSNFKQAGHLLHCTPERALLGFVVKHIVALADFVNDLEGGLNQTSDRWSEKIGDITNYMILLEGLIVERIQQENEQED